MSADRFHEPTLSASESEDVDMDVERRREILAAEARLDHVNHWELLGIPWNASAAAARAAYLEKAKVFHPDRHPGKRIGSYRARLERVFRRLTEAHDVLADERRRAEYARATAGPAQFARIESRALEDERRTAERRARLARQNPLLQRAGRVHELVRRGKSALAEGRFGTAANDLALARGMDPSNQGLAALAADARRRAGAARASEILHKGVEAALIGNVAGALALFREALAADPRNVRAAVEGARAALAIGDLGAARSLAEAALHAGRAHAEAHEALGLVLEAEGRKKEARRALEKAVELDPGLDRARERLKKLRWGFLG